MSEELARRTMARRGFLAGLGAAALAPAFAGPAAGQQSPQQIQVSRGAPQRIAGGRAHSLADVTFEVASDYPGAATGLEIGAGAEIDLLRIRVPPGVSRVDRFLSIGQGARIGRIDVEAAAQTAPHDEQLDGFVQIRDSDIHIGEMRFVRIDRCVMIHRAARVWIGAFDCASYSKGIKIDESEDIHIGRFGARIASPHALPKPGYNGLTIANSRRLDLPRVVVEDAAEHAIYLAGGGGVKYSEEIRFGEVIARRSGQCGFKCKAPKTASRGVSIDRLKVTDAAFRSRPGRNEDALRVENCHDFHVGRLDVGRAEAKASCHAGVYLNGVTGFSLYGGHVDRPAGPMVMIEDSRGPNTGITISGLNGSRLGSHGYYLHLTGGEPLLGMSVDGGRLEGVKADVVRIEGNAEIPPEANHIRLEASQVRGRLHPAPADIDMSWVEVSEVAGRSRARRR